jgi:hypothetical protein
MTAVDRFVMWTDRFEEHRLQRGVAWAVIAIYGGMGLVAGVGLWWWRS